MDEMGKKFGVRMENVGNKAEAKIAVKDLKAGLREMKRENGKIGKHEKKEVKRAMKGLKKDLKEQFKETMRNEKARRKEGKRNGMDGGRCGERRTRGGEVSEQRRWDTEGVARGDMGQQVTGLTEVHDMDPYRPRDDMKR